MWADSENEMGEMATPRERLRKSSKLIWKLVFGDLFVWDLSSLSTIFHS